MKAPGLPDSADLFADIGPDTFAALYGGDSFQFSLERGENGRLTEVCRQRLTESLRGFLNRPARRARLPAWCAVEARGVSLRRLSLPPSAKEEFARILRLQIESELPLSPQELAWGWRLAGAAPASQGGGPPRQEVLVAAVKKESLEDYERVFQACGVVPFFTVAALAREAFYPATPAGPCAVLHLGSTHSEWVGFDGGPISIRVIPWGEENITRSIQENLRLSHDEAEKIKAIMGSAEVRKAVAAALPSLARYIRPGPGGGRIYLTGKSARSPQLPSLLSQALGGDALCVSLETEEGAARSPAIAGLKKIAADPQARGLLILDSKEDESAAAANGKAAWQWAAAAAILAAAVLLFPYGETLLLTPRLEKKLALVNAGRGRLDTIDQELAFLQNLKQEQPPYVDTLYLLAGAAPQGTRLEPLSLSRRGEISLRATMANGQQVTDFRSKLIDSGWFTNVVVEEQTPTQDRRVSVRMSAQLKPLADRKPLAVEAPAKKPGGGDGEKAKAAGATNSPSAVKSKT